MKFEIGPTGRLIKGHVLDVSKSKLEEAFKAYDALLYIKWNPKKMRGHGCWELRRRPEFKSVVQTEVYAGNTYSFIDYKEIDLENHVLDLPVLDYSTIARLKKMDLWANSGYDRHNTTKINHFWDKMDSVRDEQRSAAEQKNYDNMLYNFRQNKSAIRTLKEAVLSGVNPAEIARYWK